LVVALLVQVLLPWSLFAQAWLPEKGEGSLTLTYQKIAFNGHFNTDGLRNDRRQSRANSAVFEFEYGIADRTALNAAIPYIASKYTGLQEPFAAVFVDDKTYHGNASRFPL
jgi:hypothetical protein